MLDSVSFSFRLTRICDHCDPYSNHTPIFGHLQFIHSQSSVLYNNQCYT